MRAEVFYHVIKRNAEVLHERHFRTRLIIPRYHFAEDRVVACLLHVSYRTEDEPHWIVVETTTDIVVSTLGERLILMVATAIGELRRGNINNTLASAFGHLMHETNKVLVRIAETHTSAYTTLKERSRTREVEGDHTLILIPDIHHAVQTFISTRKHKLIEQVVPHQLEFLKCSIHGLYRSETGNAFLCFLLIDKRNVRRLRSDEFATLLTRQILCTELLLLRIFYVAEEENIIFGLTRSKGQFDIMRCDGAPAVSQTVGRLTCHHALRIGKLIV